MIDLDALEAALSRLPADDPILAPDLSYDAGQIGNLTVADLRELVALARKAIQPNDHKATLPESADLTIR